MGNEIERDESQSEAIREQVSEAYTEALRRSVQGGKTCCSAPAATAAKHAGYSEELETHAEAGKSSFGCGNPLAFSQVQPGETVLDLGSGAGLDLLVAADKVGPTGHVIGVDMTDDMLAAARENAARAGYQQVELRKGVIEELPVEAGTVDWVISNCVVNLSPQKQRVFDEIARVLAPGGRFSISDIVVEELPQELRELAAAYAACVGGAISEREYVAGLEAAGLVDVEVGERLVYDLDQIRGLIASDFDWSGAGTEVLEGCLAKVDGQVASVRFSGRKP